MSSNTNRKRKATVSSNAQPHKKSKLAEGLISDPSEHNIQFQVGQIRRIVLTNWMTFDHAEILPSPGLNSIIGPNGAGKSSIAAAICLGVGGKPKNLGRGDSAKEFIKHGRNSASIQIELHNNGIRNDVIKRIITTEGGSKWKLNGKKKTMKQIDKFVKDKRNIKVDNLCQFLAQDRVSEFARLTPEELLEETEKAIEDQQLFTWHKFLKEVGKKSDQGQKEMDNLRTTLRQNQSEKSSLTKTIEQFERKKTMEKKVKVYKALYHWTEAIEKGKKLKRLENETKRLKAEADRKKANIQPLKTQKSDCTKQLQKVNRVWATHEKNMKKAQRNRLNAFKRVKNVCEEVEELQDNIASSVEEYKEKMKKIRKVKSDLDKFEAEFAKFDETEIVQCLKRRKNILKSDVKPLREAKETLTTDLRKLTNQKKNHSHNLQQITHGLQRMKNVSQRKEEHIFGPKNKNDRQFMLWVDSHKHEFKGEVYGPIAREITVTDDLHANYLNNSMGYNQFYAYVCTDKHDWVKLTRQMKECRLSRTVYLDNDYQSYRTQRICDHQTLRANGVEGYLDEIFEAPQIIKVTLNKHLSLDRKAYAMRDMDQKEMDNVLLTRKGQRNRLMNVLTPKVKWFAKASHYSNNVMRGNSDLNHWGKRGIIQKSDDFAMEIEQKEREERDIITQLESIEAERSEIEAQRKELQKKIAAFMNEKKGLEIKVDEFRKLKNKTQRKRKVLAELEADNTENPQQIQQRYSQLIAKKNLERMKHFENLAKDIEILTKLMQQSSALQVKRQYFESEKTHIAGKIQQIQRRNSALMKEYKQSLRISAKCKRTHLANVKKLSRAYPLNKYKPQWTSEDRQMSLLQIDTKLNHLHGTINALLIDPNRVERYQRLTVQIEKQTRALAKLEREHSKTSNAIKDIENQYKPKLEAAIDKISRKFSEFFEQFNKAQGTIVLVSTNKETGEALKYDEWCIDILTKFRRDQKEWKRLTSSSQSGGEKSVSTMLYLLSMQEVTTVPFRVVDEINQGMDAKNERRIMTILNYECTPKPGNRQYLPQYFVITPKLLPRLTHSPCSSVHVIFNGPYQMPQQDWTPKEFIQTQKGLTDMNGEETEEESD